MPSVVAGVIKTFVKIDYWNDSTDQTGRESIPDTYRIGYPDY